MTWVRCIVAIVFVVLLSIVVYLAWLNRASDKLVQNVISVALAGVTAVLVTTLFSIGSDSIEESIYKSYVFDKISKFPLEYILNNESKPFVSAFAGPRMMPDPGYFVQELVKKDPSLGSFEKEKPFERVSKLYHDIIGKYFSHSVPPGRFHC
jgi:hypothetical protein